HPAMPAYAAFFRSRSHLAWGGYLGKQYDPFPAHEAAELPVYTNVGADTGRTTRADLFRLAREISHERLQERRRLVEEFDGLRRDLDVSGSMAAMDRYGHQAVELVLGRRAREAFDLSRESDRVRDRYGKHLWCQQALLTRRLVQAGVAFVTLDLSYHPASG